MIMFHVEQSIRNQLKELLEKVNCSRRVEVLAAACQMTRVPRADSLLTKLMGEEVEERRNFIADNAERAVLDI